MYQNGFFRDPVNFLIMAMNKIEKVVTWNLPKLAQSNNVQFFMFQWPEGRKRGAKYNFQKETCPIRYRKIPKISPSVYKPLQT